MSTSLRTAVLGVSGYSGAELVRLLLTHPQLRNTPPVLCGRDAQPVALTALHPHLSGLPHADTLTVEPFSLDAFVAAGINILFLATPHELSRELVPDLLQRGLKVVDLSGAWRLHDPANAAVYKLTDPDPALAAAIQREAVYGAPDLHAAAIARARLVANPGCYATSVILALAPLVKAGHLDLTHGIIADAKSGVSGAGKAPTATTHFMHAADNLSAYNVFGHRHTGELLEQLSLTRAQVQFTPHLLPVPRGILSTIYACLSAPADTETLQSLYDNFFSSPLIRIRRSPSLPELQYTVRTPFCDIGFAVSPDGHRIVIVSTLDNLLKGAASQAVENMNLMAGWPQAEGLL